MQRQEYLKHFRGTKYQKQKVLPHISEGFIFKRRNQMMINRIINPKRDKLIQRSLQSAINSTRYSSKKHHSSFFQPKTQEKAPSQSLHHHKQTFYSHIVSQKPLRSKHLQVIHNTIRQDSKQNILNETKLSSRKNHTRQSIRYRRRQLNSNQRRTLFKTLIQKNLYSYGCGPTVLAISKLKIQSNPPLKQDTLIILQLIEKCSIPHLQEQKTIRSSPLSLNYMSDKGIKFSMKISSIGDFIPLRIFRCSGMNCIEIGRLDIQLNSYRTQTLTDNCTVETQHKGQYLFRNVVTQVLNTTQDTSTEISFQCKIYTKRFQKRKMIQ